MIKWNTWYKVFYKYTAYNGNEYITFEFAMNEQVEKLENEYKAEGTYVKTAEWII